MLYTQEMKLQINAMGLQVVEFKYLIQQRPVMESLWEKISEELRQIINLIKNDSEKLATELQVVLSKTPPRQRYKVVKRIGPEKYRCFFRRIHIYKARSCC